MSATSDANLDSVFVENTLLFAVPKFGRARKLPLPPPFPNPIVNDQYIEHLWELTSTSVISPSVT